MSRTSTRAGEERLYEVGSEFSIEEGGTIWEVLEGRVDLFVTPAGVGISGGPRRHLWSAMEGSAIFGFPPDEASAIALVAVAVGGTRLRLHRLESSSEGQPPAGDIRTLHRLAEGFVRGVSHGFADDGRAPAEFRLLPNRVVTVKAGQRATANDRSLWVEVESGTVYFAGDKGIPITAGEGPFTLGPGVWVTGGDGEAEISTADVASWAEDRGDDPLPALRSFQRLLRHWAERRAAREAHEETERLTRKAQMDAQVRSRGLLKLTTLLHRSQPEEDLEPEGGVLFTALKILGREAGIDFLPAPDWEKGRGSNDLLGAICRASRIRYRQVGLRGEWWKEDAGPLLGFREGGEELPVVLLWKGKGEGYEAVDPVTLERQPVTPAVADRLEKIGFTFYARPPDVPLTGRQLLEMGFKGMGPEIRSVVALATGGALLGLLVPVTTDHVFDSVIPAAQVGNALLLAAALVGVHIGQFMFEAARAFAVLRVQGKAQGGLQAAFVDRLLSLPVPFFRQYTVGDMADRVGAINALRDIGSAAAVNAIIGGITSVVYLALLLYYSWRLALLALVIVVLGGAFTVFMGSRAVRLQREAQRLEGSISGLVFQLLSGITKLRVTGAEGRGFSRWSEEFTKQKAFGFRAGMFENTIEVFNKVLPLAAAALLFYFVGRSDPPLLETSRFVAFNLAFGTFFRSATSFSDTLVLMLAAIPIMERAKPILEKLPESPITLSDPGELTGRVEVASVTFRYREGGPVVLDGVSMVAHPGEFVALVGPSGSGKSSVLRLLLGFEEPEAGSVMYDGQDIRNVDVTGVRTQLGVVLQASKVSSGTILDNIIGSSPLSVDDAWEAAEMAGLVDDVKAMPMGLYTVVSEGGTTLSGGQRQRLLIARALVQKPRILLFDEATSALDNRTQEVVSRALEEMAATRIVIAHRLSTIRNADRIYVMKAGRIVQQGRFEALMEEGGLFGDLVQRQVI